MTKEDDKDEGMFLAYEAQVSGFSLRALLMAKSVMHGIGGYTWSCIEHGVHGHADTEDEAKHLSSSHFRYRIEAGGRPCDMAVIPEPEEDADDYYYDWAALREYESAISGKGIAVLLLEDPVIDAIRGEIHKRTGREVDWELVFSVLRHEVVRPELLPGPDTGPPHDIVP